MGFYQNFCMTYFSFKILQSLCNMPLLKYYILITGHKSNLQDTSWWRLHYYHVGFYLTFCMIFLFIQSFATFKFLPRKKVKIAISGTIFNKFKYMKPVVQQKIVKLKIGDPWPVTRDHHEGLRDPIQHEQEKNTEN